MAAGCCAGAPLSQQDRSRIRGIGIGFSAQPGQQKLLNLPLPAYATGTWMMAIGCKGCVFRLGINATRCGEGWMGFPSEETVLSPDLAARLSVDEALELAGQNFTCVPVINATVRPCKPCEPVITLFIQRPTPKVQRNVILLATLIDQAGF